MNMDLSEDERALIGTIVGGEKAWSKVGSLARAGHDLDTVADLILRKILEPWPHPDDGDSVTLAPFGAYLWAELRTESLELAERPCTVHRKKRVQGEIIPIRESERVNFWVEGGKPDRKRSKRHVEDYGLIALAPDRSAGPEVLLDEATGEAMKLFEGLFNGQKVKGIQITVDQRLKGAKKPKGKSKGAGAKTAKAKQRRAG